MNTRSFSQTVRRLFFFALCNIPVSLLITLPLFLMSRNDALTPFLPTVIMFVSNLSFLNLILFGFICLAALLKPPAVVLKTLCFVFFLFLQIFLVADVKIFSFFKFHINAVVINFLRTEGAGDSLKLGVMTIVSYCAIVIAAGVFEFLLVRYSFSDKFGKLRLRLGQISLFIIGLMLLDKGMYAYADIMNKPEILSGARYYPFYTRITVKRLARKFGVQLEREKNLNFSNTGKILQYPKEPVSFKTGAPAYNVVFIVVDGFRADMFTPEVTPYLHKFAQNNIRMENHYSGGNGTRFGIFSLFYGLYSNLWHPFLASMQSPVLIDSLIEKKYQFLIMSATRLTFPEFRKTAFVKIPDAIIDSYEEPKTYKRDKLMVSKFNAFLQTRDTARPFFSFVFFNSSHQFYQYPPEYEKFKPALDEQLNYMTDFSDEQMQQMKNRYQNSLFYLDTLIKDLISALAQRNLLDNTIVVITSDHGEEFKENGYFSHNSAFDDYQIKVPLIMKVPGRKTALVQAMTSHLDIVPTVLNILGAQSDISGYSHGKDIFSPNSQSIAYTFSSDWDLLAIVTRDHRLIVPISSERSLAIELRTARDYSVVKDADAIRKQLQPALIQATIGLSQFLK